MKAAPHDDNSENDIVRKTVRLLDFMATTADDKGITLTASTPVSFNHFRLLQNQIQVKVFNVLEDIAGDITRIDKKLDKLEQEKKLLRDCLDKLNLSVHDDVFKLMTGDQVVEIYDIESNIQIFRNFEFMKMSSYDLMTMMLIPYPELFYRDPEIEKQLQERAKWVVQNANGPVPWEVPNHVIVEKMEKHNNSFELLLDIIAPVFDSQTGARKAWLSLIKARPLGSAYKDLGNVVPI